MNKQLKEDLQQIYQLIDNGWCQGDYYRYDYNNDCDCYCLSGAINKTITNHVNFDNYIPDDLERFNRARDAIVTEIQKLFNSDYFNKTFPIVEFNDKHGRTKQDVLIVVAKAIENV